MKRNILLALIVAAGYILQSSLFSALPLGNNIYPDIMICIVVSFALMDGSREGLWLGFFSGLIMDLFYGIHIGMFALIYMYIGVFNGLFRRYGYAEEVKFPIFMVSVSEFSVNLIEYFFVFYLRGRTDFFYYLKSVILPKTVYTAAIAIILCSFFLFLHQKEETHQERGSAELDL